MCFVTVFEHNHVMKMSQVFITAFWHICDSSIVKGMTGNVPENCALDAPPLHAILTKGTTMGLKSHDTTTQVN